MTTKAYLSGREKRPPVASFLHLEVHDATSTEYYGVERTALMLGQDSLNSALSSSTGEFPVKARNRPERVKIEFGARTDTGRVRENNEDHFLVARLAKSMTVCQTSLPDAGATHFSDEEGYLMVVADGMGGASAGEKASALAVRSVEWFVLNTLKWFLHLGGTEEHVLYAELRQGLERADQRVFERARADATLHGMGTTLTMAYSVGTDLFIVHAGDSRAYLFHEGELQQLTNDHTLVQILVSGGTLSPEAAKRHKNRNIVTNVIGGPREGVFAEIHKLSVADGDVLLLCSDGLSEPVDDNETAEILRRYQRPADAVDRLVELALDRGGRDNITVVTARYRVA